MSDPPDALWTIRADFIMGQFMGQGRISLNVSPYPSLLSAPTLLSPNPFGEEATAQIFLRVKQTAIVIISDANT